MHLGSNFHFQCRRSTCNRQNYNYTVYTHHSSIADKSDVVVHDSRPYIRKLSSFHDGGDYCCTHQCSDDKSNVHMSIAPPECCITVTSKNTITVLVNLKNGMLCACIVLPVILWELPKAVALNGGAVTGSCSASGYPRPDVRVIIPKCDYQQENVYVGNHTNKAVFTMNITRNCEKIYCLVASTTYSILRTNELLIVGKWALQFNEETSVNQYPLSLENVHIPCTSSERQVRSISTAAKTSLSKEESNVITRNTKK